MHKTYETIIKKKNKTIILKKWDYNKKNKTIILKKWDYDKKNETIIF